MKVKYFRFDGNMKMSFFMRKSYYATIKNNNLQKNDKLKLLNLCIEKLNFMKGYCEEYISSPYTQFGHFYSKLSIFL